MLLYTNFRWPKFPVTEVYICKRNSSDVFISFFFIYISDLSTQEVCFETCLPVSSRWMYFRTNRASSWKLNIVSTRYVCFVCLYYVFYRLSATALRLNVHVLPLFKLYIVYDAIERSCFRVLCCFFFLLRIPVIIDLIPRKRRKRGRPRKTWMEGVQAAMTTRNLEPDQWRNREEWRLVSWRWWQLLKNRVDRYIDPCSTVGELRSFYSRYHFCSVFRKAAGSTLDSLTGRPLFCHS